MPSPPGSGDNVSHHALFEASDVHKVREANQHLLLVETVGPGGRRCFCSWTSTSLVGSGRSPTRAMP
ncbi:non-reducing end alpha-L-arabinofuranosidase family hydrolase [Streptomyces poonensis]|uniref:non-reducing end alpha-L-arabinofuranosidase family hydrolase n=1 Tax=Streptomyces poonensis TaxID=68255 RepID=UPI00227D729C|nr:non-reducing end alpha-L-arabinofuranosidase family hydrolase [Streptomyces poonensis]